MCHSTVSEPLSRYAEDAASEALAALPATLARSKVAAAQAQRVATALGRPRPDILVSAAWLHAIGEAPALHRCGLPAVDGATFLLDQGWPTPTINLVAHQLQSRMLAQALGCAPSLRLFERVQGWPADIVDYAILTSDEDGPIPLEAGLGRIRDADIAHPEILATVREERQARLRRAGERVHRAVDAMSEAVQ